LCFFRHRPSRSGLPGELVFSTHVHLAKNQPVEFVAVLLGERHQLLECLSLVVLRYRFGDTKKPNNLAVVSLGVRSATLACVAPALSSLVECEPPQIGMESGARRALIPSEKKPVVEVSGDIIEKVDPIFFSDQNDGGDEGVGHELNGCEGTTTWQRKTIRVSHVRIHWLSRFYPSFNHAPCFGCNFFPMRWQEFELRVVPFGERRPL